MKIATVRPGLPTHFSRTAGHTRPRCISMQDAIHQQAQEEIGPEPILNTHDLMVKRKYGVLDPLFTGNELQIIRRAA
jgi:hypothetical protein